MALISTPARANESDLLFHCSESGEFDDFRFWFNESAGWQLADSFFFAYLDKKMHWGLTDVAPYDNYISGAKEGEIISVLRPMSYTPTMGDMYGKLTPDFLTWEDSAFMFDERESISRKTREYKYERRETKCARCDKSWQVKKTARCKVLKPNEWNQTFDSVEAALKRAIQESGQGNQF